jgi:tryptophanyl-tRNA synthetase
MNINELLQDNRKLVESFGAKPVSDLKDVPDFYTFKRGLVYSHRDFDDYYSSLKSHADDCTIVSGFNASGTIHLGHKAVFDTNLFFQKKYGMELFVPISDDESYVSGKVKTQEEGLKNSINLVRELVAYGFDPSKTNFVIDQIYTNIYNLAIKLSKRSTISTMKATYGYTDENNPGLMFYPAIQAAHVLLPQEEHGYKRVLVPIGPDEDAHLRICRDLASKEGYVSPAVLHLAFVPGTDGEKMSKSRNNAIFLKDSPKAIREKVSKAFSGGADTIQNHRKYGGNPDNDVSCIYLRNYFLDDSESKKLFEDYRSGSILSGEVKELFSEKVIEFTQDFQSRLDGIKISDVKHSILSNNDLFSVKLSGF